MYYRLSHHVEHHYNILYNHLKFNLIKQEMDPLYNRFSTYLPFLYFTTFEPTEEIDLRYLSLFFIICWFLGVSKFFHFYLQSAQAWGLCSWTYTSKYSETCAVRHLSFQTSCAIRQLNIYGPKVFMLTKIKPEYSDILDNLIISPILRCVELDRVHCSWCSTD